MPKEEWTTIAGETTTILDLYITYIVILAAIEPVASIIGMSIVGIRLPFVGSLQVPIATAVASAFVHYILTLVGVYILALIIDALAPTFSGERNISQAFKVATYIYTPIWIIGVIAIIPTLGILGILGLYGLYLLYLGLPILMKSPQEKSSVYIIVVIIAAIVIFVMISYIPRVVILYSHYSTPSMPIHRIR